MIGTLTYSLAACAGGYVTFMAWQRATAERSGDPASVARFRRAYWALVGAGLLAVAINTYYLAS